MALPHRPTMSSLRGGRRCRSRRTTLSWSQRKVKTMRWIPVTQRLKTVELRNQQDQKDGTLGNHQATSMDLITLDVWSDFSQRGDDASGYHFGQPSAGGEVLWKLHQYCADHVETQCIVYFRDRCLTVYCFHCHNMSILGNFRNC